MLNKELFEEIGSWLNRSNSIGACVLIDKQSYILKFYSPPTLKTGCLYLHAESADCSEYILGLDIHTNRFLAYSALDGSIIPNKLIRNILIQLYTQLFTPQT